MSLKKYSEKGNRIFIRLRPGSKGFGLPGFLFLILLQLSAYAQDINYALVSEYDSRFKKAGGADENLINGYQYINPHPLMEGHAFLDHDEFVPGKLVINNKTYQDVDLKYDILNQEVLLSYENSFGNINHLILQKSFIGEFDLADKHFEKIHFAETGTQFFQVISTGNPQCLYRWEKTLTASSSSSKRYYKYSNQKKRTYLVVNNTLKQYKSNRSFVKLFPAEHQGEITAYLKSNKINVQKASDASVRELIEYCEQLKSAGDK